MLPIVIHKKRKIKRLSTLHFEREELLYDIGSYCFVEGDIMKTENEHAKHQVIDVTQDGNIDRVTRVLDLKFAECVELCYPYTKQPICFHASLDNELEETDDYIMRLWLPDTFSCTTLNLLKTLIHEYLVYCVLADWLGITNPEAAVKWEKKAGDMEDKIRSSINSRIGAVTRPMRPF